MDIGLAISHHLLVFALAAVLSAELALLRSGMDAAVLRRIAGLDTAYGLLAGVIIVVGFSRVFFGDKGSAFYVSNPVFWAKIGAFVVVGLLSMPPTVKILKWRRALNADRSFVPEAREIQTARRYMHAEAGVFLLIPVFAALMARGIGL